MEEKTSENNKVIKDDEFVSRTDDGVKSKKSVKEVKSTGKTGEDFTTKKVLNKGTDEDLPEKRTHAIGEGFSLFPIHTWLFFIYIITAIILAVFGTLLLINGNFANTGYFTFQAIINNPWPKLEVEDEDHHAMALEFLQLTCWICGFFFWLFALYLVYVIHVYNSLLWAARPWDRQAWNGVRVAANQVMVQAKVRDETEDKQFNRMNKKQQEKMSKYRRPIVEPVKYV